MEKTAKQRFATRLKMAMLDRGLVAKRDAKSGVDARWLAETAGVTREMARRYLSGSLTAMPEPDKMKKIADGLKCSLLWLRDGIGHQENAPLLHSTNVESVKSIAISDPIHLHDKWLQHITIETDDGQMHINCELIEDRYALKRALPDDAVQVANDWMSLPEEERRNYALRIHLLADAYRVKVPGDVKKITVKPMRPSVK